MILTSTPRYNPARPNAFNAAAWVKHSLSFHHNRLWGGDSAYKFGAQINNSLVFATQGYTTVLQTAPLEFLVTYNKYYHPGNGVPGCQHDTPAGGVCSTAFAMKVAVIAAAAVKNDDDRSSVAPPRQQKTLAQYQQQSADFGNGALDVSRLLGWLRRTHSNTMSFLLWDTNGQNYLDMVRFLEQTKNDPWQSRSRARIRVWVTLIPPSEARHSPPWPTGCVKCPPDRPFPYGEARGGIFCCTNKTDGRNCHAAAPVCCIYPGSRKGCQGVQRCGNNLLNRTYCAGDPSLAPGTSQCSVPADSPLTPFNESAMVNTSIGYRGCQDVVGWARILSRLAEIYPALTAVNIDDFARLGTNFVRGTIEAMHAALHAGKPPGVSLIPTFYYGSAGHFVLRDTPWLINATDGTLFYFMNLKAGQTGIDSCKAVAGCASPPACPIPCLHGVCAEASLPNLAGEISDFVKLLPADHPLHIGLYFSGYSRCGKPSDRYAYEALRSALAMPAVSGVTVYTLENPDGVCVPVQAGDVPVGKQCIVASVFANYTVAAAGVKHNDDRNLSPMHGVVSGANAVRGWNSWLGSTSPPTRVDADAMGRQPRVLKTDDSTADDHGSRSAHSGAASTAARARPLLGVQRWDMYSGEPHWTGWQ
jgi:hypothetical protein